MPLNLENIDLGGFGVSKKDDPELKINTQVRANMNEALKINPDNHAQITNLSKQSGVPEFAVQSNPDEVEHKLKLDKINFNEMSKRNPNTAKYLVDFNNSVIAQDDIDVLQSIENGLQKVKDYAIDISESFERGQLTVESSEIGLSRMYQALGANEIVTDDQLTRLKEIEELTKTSTDKYGFFTGAPQTAAEQIPIMFEILRTGLGYAATTGLVTAIPGAVVGAGAGGVGAIPGALATGLPGAKFGGRIGVAKAAFDLEAGMAFNEYAALKDEQGNLLDPKIAGGAAALVGAVNAGLEFISLARLGRTVTPVMRSVIRSKVKRAIASETGRQMITRLMKDYGIAVATEAVTESAQEFTTIIGGELAKYIDEDSFTEQDLSSALDNIFSEETGKRVVEAGAKGAQASMIFAGAGTTASVIVETRQREKLSENEQLRIDSINENVKNSKLRERDKESFKQFVEQADEDNNTHVFIDGAQTALYLQNKTPEQIEADPALKLLANQAQEAANLGTDVQVPIADFAADIVGTEHFEQLRDSMTMSDQTISPFRQEQARQETETYVRSLMNEVQENTSEYVQAQEIYNNVREQLIDTGQVNAQNASIMAQIVPAWATAQARRQGKTVEQVYTDAGLTIEGPLTGERARLEAEGILKQEPAFKDTPVIFEAARDKFLSVLPEDATFDELNDVISEFKPEYKNFIKALEEDDWLGFDFPSQAINAALSEELENFDPSQKLKRSIGRLVNVEFEGMRPFEQRRIINEQITRRPEEIDDRQARQEIIEQAKTRDDATALAEFNRAKAGETVTFLHRSFDDFSQFDDNLLGTNTTTPSGNLGHYLSAADIENIDRYGNELSVHQFTFENPIVISAETFSNVMSGLTSEEVMERRQALMDMGHDGVLVEGLNWAIAFEGKTLTKLEEDVELLLAQPPRKGPQVRGYYDPSNSIIRLTEASDLSTFLHEFAHFMYEMEVNNNTEMLQSINDWYKRNAEDVAKEANDYLGKESDAAKQNGEPTIKPGSITEEDVITFLNNNTTGVKDKDAAIHRAVHEHFARGFETYLMEGKAPSIELRNAFRAFARWLSRIYQSLRGQLDVKLDDEMRQVFDRLLATEEQIEAAEARARVEPMFTNAAMAGMTEEEFIDYKARQEKVKDVQSETLRDKIIKQLTRQTKAWWKEEKQDVIDEELIKLNNKQVYTAINRLRDGDIKLDHATVKEMVGESKTDKLGRVSIIIPSKLIGLTAKGKQGVHPDEAALFFGYRSGSEMLKDIIDSPAIKVQAEINAEAIMIERHGDILRDGTIEKEADEAVQNEERGKLILHELKILARGTNAPTIDRATIKALSEERISKLSFREIHPGKYRKAEIRAAQEATRMLGEGNKEGAAAAKMRQVMNYYLGMAATNAKNETVKIVDRMTRYNKKKVREAIQKVEGGYWDQITKILDRFEFRKSATLKEVESLNAWVKERIEIVGDGLVLSNAVLNESYVTHWKNVPFADLQGINDSVKNIEHVARYADKLTRMQEEISFNKLVDRWTTSMNENVKTRFVSKRTDIVEGKNWGRWLMAQMTKIPFMASWLDGGERAGISHQIMVQPFTDAYNAELKLWEKAGKPVMDLIEGRDKETRKRHNRKIYIPEIDDNLFGHQILAVALNTGNESNLRKLLLGEGWADPEVETEINFDNSKLQAVLSHMTKSDWELVQKIWDQMETLYPELAEVHRRTTGLTPPKIEATPIKNSFGEFKGGYYPVKYDPNRDQRAAFNEDKLNAEIESMFSNNASIQASVNTGATNERTKYYAPIRLSLDVVPAHFQETIHYITHHDAVREVNRLIRNKQVAQTIKEKLGPEEYAQLRPWLNDIAKDGREAPTKMFWDDILQRLRFGVTLGTMGFKASTGIIQISGLSNSISEVGLASMFQSMRSILGSVTTMKQAWEFAVDNSKVLAHRTQTMDREIKNAMKRIEGKRGILAAVQEVSMKHIAYIQTYMVDLPSWHAAYIKGMKEWGDETRAFQYADWVIENVQGSGVTKDLARIMRNQSETGRMFTMFMTFFSSLWNMERDLVKGVRTGRYSTTNIAAKIMFLFTVPVLFEMMMRGELGEPEDGEDERLQKMLVKTAMYPVQSIPFIRDVASATTGEFGYNISPLQAIIEQGTQTIPEIVKRGFTDEEITQGQIKGATKFIGAAAGIPGTGQIWATGEHLHDVIQEGEELTLRELLFGPKRK